MLNSRTWGTERLTNEELLQELRLMTPSRIKKIRSSFKLTQESFADLCDISYHTYKNWEIGHRKPCTSGVALLKLAEQNSSLFLKKARNKKRIPLI